MQRQVLEAETRIFGPDSPTVLTSMGNLAEYLGDLGRDDEAKIMFCRRIELSQRRFGSTNNKTLRCVLY